MERSLRIEQEVALGPLTSLGLGGPARYFVEVKDQTTLVQALDWAAERGLPTYVLGGGSNVVVADQGCNGLVLRIRLRGLEVRSEAGQVRLQVASGEPWDDLVAMTVAQGWAGLECMSGIPGLAGATPIQNTGAYGQEVSQCIQEVWVLDRADRSVLELPASSCRFGYRDSRFRSTDSDRYVVLAVTFLLTPDGVPSVTHTELVELLGSTPASLAEVRQAVLELRRRKSMLLEAADENGRSCGSFFVNPVVEADQLETIRSRLGAPNIPCFSQPDGRIKLSAAWLIERAGFSRGTRLGPVGVSSRHALALVCHAGATSTSLVQLATRIRDAVLEQSGVLLRPEPAFWGFERMDYGLPVL